MGYDSSVQNIYSGNGGPASPALTEGGGFYYSLTRHIDEEMMWQMNLRMNEEVMEGGPYPERLGQPDCAYYMRTGLCRFGMTCRYNHPPNRKLAVVAATMRGGYPERIGQPECEYYLKTGTCKFGATCKFHHPREKAGIAGRGAQLNELGYPLRMNEVECAYYLRTGQCKFGSTCKFHHPEPSNMVRPLHSSIYPTVHSPSTAQQSYPGALTNWPVARASFIPSPRWQGISNYAQMILPQELVQVPGWNPYTGQLGSASPSPNQQQARGNAQYYSSPRQGEMSTAGAPPGSFSSYHIGSVPSGVYGLQRDNVFPERPNEPECQFYMKTGDCKFGPVCRFHHPRERAVSIPDCMLSSLGLPLRPGEPVCVFYSRYGSCKFGINCKFDHPTTVFPYGGVPSYSTDVPIQNFGPSSSEPVTLTLPLTQVSVDAVETNNKPRRLSSQLSASDEKPEPKG